MSPYPRYGLSSSGRAVDPLMAAVWVGSCAEGRNAVPKSIELILRLARPFVWCWPTYETSSDEAHGSASCTPPFHWCDLDSGASYSNVFSAEAPRVRTPEDSAVSVE